MANITIGAVALPEDLQWIDEYADGSDLVGQTVSVSVTGALVIQASAQQAGRRMTLQGRMEGNVGFAAITRAQVEALRSLAAVPDATYTVSLGDGRTFTARFRRDDGPAVEASPMKHIVPPVDEDLYFPTIRLLLV